MIEGYRLMLASDGLDRDGIAMELQTDDGDQVAEVFEDDATGERTFKAYTDHPIPLAAIEWLMSEAAAKL